jgi:hypothetical protein
MALLVQNNDESVRFSSGWWKRRKEDAEIEIKKEMGNYKEARLMNK